MHLVSTTLRGGVTSLCHSSHTLPLALCKPPLFYASHLYICAHSPFLLKNHLYPNANRIYSCPNHLYLCVNRLYLCASRLYLCADHLYLCPNCIYLSVQTAFTWCNNDRIYCLYNFWKLNLKYWLIFIFIIIKLIYF